MTPFGGQDGASEDIIWSDPVEFYDEYRELSVDAVAQSNAVTVFVRSGPEGAVGVNNIYVDDAQLIQVGQTDLPTDAPTPTPEGDDSTPTTPTASPTTTTTPGAGTPTATATAVPDSVEEFPNRLTYTVTPGDTVVGLATEFNSTIEAIIDANGLNESGLIVVGQQLVIPVPEGQGEPVTTLTPVATVSPTPAEGATTPLTTAAAPGTYVVQTGDNLFRIALRFNTTVEALATLNNITNPNLVIAGTVLRVPTGGSNAGTGGTSGGGVHVVQPGENAFRIALRYGITVEQLAAVNSITNPNLVFTGQRLVIPQ
ncbi:MAG: LysM peptidoglycan-binding domain-containing protein [Anaerolineae bacterium]|nr:LysM peptidoglycan-binding domain-containing protein [Anaerolineae bacterium]